ncbi:hypothetical protein FB446DRAFT_794438 [Lentinula raphanica]|nr:hypothetical protein FB446DRAFT_794438 [Lentinula raphanica]
MLPNHFLAFLSTIGVALTAVAAPLPHATTHGESPQDDSGLEAPQALVYAYEHATSTDSLDPSTLPGALLSTLPSALLSTLPSALPSALPNALSGAFPDALPGALSDALPNAPPSTPPSTPNDGLWAENISPIPICRDPSINSGCPSGLFTPIARPVIVEARTGDGKDKEVMNSPHAAGVPSPQIAVGDSIPDGHTVLKYLAEQGSYPSVQNVHKALKSLDPAQWEKDVTVSKTLMVFKQTVSGELYMHTDELLRESRPAIDRVELESMLLKDLFISVNLRPHQQIRYTTLTKHGYSCLQELRTYVKDTRNSKDLQEFKSTYSGRLLQTLYEAIRSFTSQTQTQGQTGLYRIEALQFWVDQDIRQLSPDPATRASYGLLSVLGQDWDAEQKVCTRGKDYLVSSGTQAALNRLVESAPDPVAAKITSLWMKC